MGTHAHTHTSSFTQVFLKGKKPTQSIALEVTLPEEFCTEVIIYCLAQLKLKEKSEPIVLVPFQDIPPFKTTQAKIFTKVRHSHSLNYIKRKKKSYERD